jgi:hypothetical protein
MSDMYSPRIQTHAGMTAQTLKCVLCGVTWSRYDLPKHTPNNPHTAADWQAYQTAHGLGPNFPRFIAVGAPPPPTP